MTSRPSDLCEVCFGAIEVDGEPVDFVAAHPDGGMSHLGCITQARTEQEPCS